MFGAEAERRLAAGEVLVLDGGLATELERRGLVLDELLWSASVLAERPEAILAVHADAVDAGADIVTTATYQASFDGFAGAGLPAVEARRLFRSAVTLARRAGERRAEPLPLVAASIGPYGAALADGSEYRGRYGVSRRELRRFHEERWRLLAEATGLIACETLPDLDEILVLAELLESTPRVRAWFSFSCRDTTTLADGTGLDEVARRLSGCPRLLAIGVNCVPPAGVLEQIEALRSGAPRAPIVVYPNSGERYDAATGGWSADGGEGASTGPEPVAEFRARVRGWISAGARIVGGCCRTGPRHVRAVREEVDAMKGDHRAGRRKASAKPG